MKAYYYLMYFLGRLRKLYFNQIPENRDEMQKSRQLFAVEGIIAQLIGNLAAGTFLAGYLKYLGVSDAVNGLIASLPLITAVLQPLTALYVERLPKRKLYVCFFSFLHKTFLVIIFLVPMFLNDIVTRIAVLVVCYCISSFSASMVAPAASNWLITLLPQRIRGKYFSTREKYSMLIVAVTILTMGRVIDHFKDVNMQMGYYILVGVIAFLSISNLIVLSSIKEPEVETVKSGVTFKEMISMPFKSKAFRPVMMVTIFWQFLIQMVIPYSSIFYLNDLKLSYTMITFISFAALFERSFLIKGWGRLADKRGWAYINMLAISGLGFMHIFFVFLTAGNAIWLYPLLAALNSIFWAVLGLSVSNLQFEYAPAQGRTLFISANTAISGIIGFLGSLVGAWVVKTIGPGGIILLGFTVKAQQLLFFISGILGILTGIFIYFAFKGKTKILNKR